MYVGFENSKIDLPIKLLKGFKKVEIKPKETKSVTIIVNKNDLAYYNPETKEWVIERMKYNIFIGPSSNIKYLLKKVISIE